MSIRSYSGFLALQHLRRGNFKINDKRPGINVYKVFNFTERYTEQYFKEVLDLCNAKNTTVEKLFRTIYIQKKIFYSIVYIYLKTKELVSLDDLDKSSKAAFLKFVEWEKENPLTYLYENDKSEMVEEIKLHQGFSVKDKNNDKYYFEVFHDFRTQDHLWQFLTYYFMYPDQFEDYAGVAYLEVPSEYNNLTECKFHVMTDEEILYNYYIVKHKILAFRELYQNELIKIQDYDDSLDKK